MGHCNSAGRINPDHAIYIFSKYILACCLFFNTESERSDYGGTGVSQMDVDTWSFFNC